MQYELTHHAEARTQQRGLLRNFIQLAQPFAFHLIADLHPT